MFFCFFLNTNVRNNRAPDPRSATNATEKSQVRSGWQPSSRLAWQGPWQAGHVWWSPPSKGGACEISCWDRMHEVPHMIGAGM